MLVGPAVGETTMGMVLEIACRGSSRDVAAAREWFSSGPARHWRSLPGLRRFDAYFPSSGRAEDPFCDDGIGPLVLILIEFKDLNSLETAAAAPQISEILAALPAGVTPTAEAMQRSDHAVAGQTSAAPLVAPFSYVVRYQRPAEDEARFVEYYVKHHPALLGRLPRIRNIMCFVPVPWRTPLGISGADYMLGNEVTFDSIDDFNSAMLSRERREAREDFHRFPPFNGRNTHYPMDRVRIVG